MQARKGILNRANVARATGNGRRSVDKALLTAKKLSTDEDRKERLEKCLCLPCALNNLLCSKCGADLELKERDLIHFKKS